MEKTHRAPILMTLLAMLLLAGCHARVTGLSMGTTYAIEADCPDGIPKERVEHVLARVNRLMSTYEPESEISRFNRLPVGVSFAVSPETVDVVAAARRVAEQTGGAFDPTVAPLVALWGFGADAAERPPTEVERRAAAETVDFRRVEHGHAPPSLRKLAPVMLDLSAIAKGYAVDRLAKVLDESGCVAYLVELGGEIRAKGSARGGGAWRIGVDAPAARGFASTIALRRGGLATSGDYRQYRELDGERLSHVIDPRTGRPIRHDVASVTVVAYQAMFADAYATALLVMGEDEGRRFAEDNGLAALFILRRGEGFEIVPSAAMRDYLR
ncbi:MAG: FAD:protein FMN transferase [Gammaproteobacteria bacterium]|nr:FAD:protein FMN transferase [Gammaproteobacteria bacterium]